MTSLLQVTGNWDIVCYFSCSAMRDLTSFVAVARTFPLRGDCRPAPMGLEIRIDLSRPTAVLNSALRTNHLRILSKTVLSPSHRRSKRTPSCCEIKRLLTKVRPY